MAATYGAFRPWDLNSTPVCLDLLSSLTAEAKSESSSGAHSSESFRSGSVVSHGRDTQANSFPGAESPKESPATDTSNKRKHEGEEQSMRHHKKALIRRMHEEKLADELLALQRYESGLKEESLKPSDSRRERAAAAARKSRAKKAQRVTQLEAQVLGMSNYISKLQAGYARLMVCYARLKATSGREKVESSPVKYHPGQQRRFIDQKAPVSATLELPPNGIPLPKALMHPQRGIHAR